MELRQHHIEHLIHHSVVGVVQPQVTMVILKVVVKVGVGMDLNGFSEYLNALKAEFGGQAADYALDEEALRRVMTGEDLRGGDHEKVRDFSNSGYEALKNFIGKQEKKCANTAGYVDFRSEMKPVNDGEDGTVWVSNGKIGEWLSKLPDPPI